MLAGTRVARLGCSLDNQPYVVPVSLACYKPESGGPCFYGVMSPGQKIEWMRANQLVCVEVDGFADHDRWVSVIAAIRYGELPETPSRCDAFLRAEAASSAFMIVRRGRLRPRPRSRRTTTNGCGPTVFSRPEFRGGSRCGPLG